MTGKDALAQQYRLFYVAAKRNLEGFGHADSIVQPSPGGNCANWILGHIVDVHNAIMRLLDEAPVWESRGLDKATDEPITSPDQALDWDSMVTSLLDSEARLLEAVAAMSEEQLDEAGFTDPFGNATTRGGLLNLLAFHQNYHAGQLGLSRRLAGLPGAIRAPAGARG